MKIQKPPETLHAPRPEAIDRFQVVVYLTKTDSRFPELEMRSCEQYAHAFNWDVSLTVLDDDTETPPERRSSLQAALQRVKDQRAGAILVASKAAISPIDGEYDEFARQVEKAGGFLQVTRR
ncbi:hypothetical protein J5Y04_24545 [Kitasatospora sp. RG8]|uniref:hypothetical protein n=1 Tax=Kitasatospora sp. RG8 TaxID=2820815 RepID=UPI001AE015D1|nr:hypothetical protein [Kitasatospora sp. RG8]MBP0452687.1 hypothetical protein [Kitasatospora sp. RG8]